jgi:hypothetical protein
MTVSAKAKSYAARQRRKFRHVEWSEQIRLTRLLDRYLPDNVFWSALENAPRSALAGYLAKKRGVKAGLADIMVVYDGRVTFLEMKSPAGVPSKTQRQVCKELRAAGAGWYCVRSATAALVALRLSNVPFRREWKPQELQAWLGRLQAWQGPFTDPDRLPQAPQLAARRRAAQRRWRDRQRAREVAKLAADRADAAGADTAA